MEAVENLIFAGKILRKELIFLAITAGEQDKFSIKRSEPSSSSHFEEKEY
ncbi:MAG: hypothetical protein ACXACI_07655 [Candidatus Hodarchaeales archaeon]|jgi:hypothetical protein